MKKLITTAFVAATLVITASPLKSFAETTVGEKVQEVGQDSAKNVKKGYRAAKDAVCMKGDVECAAQKAKHKLQNAGDEVSDKADDVKKKVN